MMLRKLMLGACAATALGLLAGCGGGTTAATTTGGGGSQSTGSGAPGGSTGGSAGAGGTTTQTIQGVATPSSVSVVTATNAN